MRYKSDRFFRSLERRNQGVTYDDLSLVSQYAEVLPSEVDVSTQLYRGMPGALPIFGAAMDTVTGADLACVLSEHGGIGVLPATGHQVGDLDEVKRRIHGGRIEDPTTVRAEQTLGEILQMCRDNRLTYRSFPVVDRSNILMGLLFEQIFEQSDIQQKAGEVMLRKFDTVGTEASADEALALLMQNGEHVPIPVLPVIEEDGTLRALWSRKDLQRSKRGGATQNLDAKGRYRAACVVRVGRKSLEHAELLVQHGADALMVATAHGNSKNVITLIRNLKECWPSVFVGGGNVVTAEGARNLADAGADLIVVGQGSGAACETWRASGAYSGQAGAVAKCARGVREVAAYNGIPICADGGIKFPVHMVLAIGCGGHSVMMGSVLAGTNESAAVKTRVDGRDFASFRGMGSRGARRDSQIANEARYPTGKMGEKNFIPEGTEGYVPLLGAAADVLNLFEGGLRLGMGYVGAGTIPEMHEKAVFEMASHASYYERRTSDMLILQDFYSMALQK